MFNVQKRDSVNSSLLFRRNKDTNTSNGGTLSGSKHVCLCARGVLTTVRGKIGARASVPLKVPDWGRSAYQVLVRVVGLASVMGTFVTDLLERSTVLGLFPVHHSSDREVPETPLRPRP